MNNHAVFSRNNAAIRRLDTWGRKPLSVLLAFLLVVSTVLGSWSMPTTARAIDASTFAGLIAAPSNDTPKSGETFSVNISALLSTMDAGLMLPNTTIEIDYPSSLQYVKASSLTCAKVESASGGKVILGIVEPTGSPSEGIPDGFGPQTGNSIGGSISFQFPYGITPNDLEASIVVKIIDSGTTYRTQTVSVKAVAQPEKWTVALSPANNTVVDPSPSDSSTYASKFTSTLTNTNSAVGGMGYIYTDTVSYTQTFTIPSDVYFPYTASDVKLVSQDANAPIRLTPPAGIDPSNVSYTPTFSTDGSGNKVMNITWAIKNLPQPTTSLALTTEIKEYVDRTSGTAVLDENNNQIGTIYQPFVRSAPTATTSVTRTVKQEGSLTIAPVTAPTQFSSPVTAAANITLRDTIPLANPEGTTYTKTRDYFDKTYDSNNDGTPDWPGNGKQASPLEVGRSDRNIYYTLKGIANKDDRALQNFSIKDEVGSGPQSWNINDQTFAGIKLGEWRWNTSPPGEGSWVKVYPQLRYKVDSTWYTYGQVGANASNPDITCTVSSEITVANFLTDYKQQALGNPLATKISITGVEIYFKNIPRQFEVKPGSGLDPVLHFVAVNKTEIGEHEIFNTAKLSYDCANAQQTNISVDSTTKVIYDYEPITDVKLNKLAYVERTKMVWSEVQLAFVPVTSWELVSNMSMVAPGDILKYEVNVQNDSDFVLKNLIVNDTLDPRSDLLPQSDPRWDTIQQAKYAAPYLSDGGTRVDTEIGDSTTPVAYDHDSARDARAKAAYPAVSEVSAPDYVNNSGVVVTTDPSKPISTTQLSWLFSGHVGKSIWGENAAGNGEVMVGPGGHITISYLVKIKDPDTNWPANVPMPANWESDKADASFYVRNAFTVNERWFPGDEGDSSGRGPYSGSGSSMTQVVMPKIVAGLKKAANLSQANINQDITYTLTLCNNSRESFGNADIQAFIGPQIVDLLPEGLSFDSISSVKYVVDQADRSKDIDLDGLYTFTPISQTIDGVARTGIKFVFDQTVHICKDEQLEITYKTKVPASYRSKFTPTTPATSYIDAVNSAAAYLGTYLGSNVTYDELTFGEHSDTIPKDVQSYLLSQGYPAQDNSTSIVYNQATVEILNPILRPAIYINPTNGEGPAKSVFTARGVSPTFEVTVKNLSATIAEYKEIRDSAVQVLLPADLVFDLEKDASGNVTAAGLARLQATIVHDAIPETAAIDVASAKIESVTVDGQSRERLTVMLGSNTIIGNEDVVSMKVPTTFKDSAHPTMFDPASEYDYNVRAALIPNLSVSVRNFYVSGDPEHSPAFSASDVWGSKGLTDGVENTTKVTLHREAPRPYVRTLVSADPTSGAAYLGTTDTGSRGSDFRVNVTARNYGDDDIVDGKLYVLLPSGFLYKSVISSECAVGDGSSLASFTPVVSTVGGQTLLAFDVEKLPAGYTSGAPDAAKATAAQISLSILVGSGSVTTQSNEVVSFLATQETVLTSPGTPALDEKGNPRHNYFIDPATKLGVTTDYLGRPIGYAGLTATENITVVATDERDPDFIQGSYDLNQDGDDHYVDYHKVGGAFAAMTPPVTIIDRAVRHSGYINLQSFFNMDISKSVRAFDSNTGTWSAPSSGNIPVESVRGGKVEYTVALTNSDNTLLGNIKLLDVFPYAGDMGTLLQGTSRGSEFSLTGSKSFNLHVKKGATPETATEVDPSLYAAGLSNTQALVPNNDSSSSANTWNIPAKTGIFAADATEPFGTSTGLKIDFDSSVTVANNESLFVTFVLDVPYNAPLSTDSLKKPAYNTAATSVNVLNANTQAKLGDAMLESTRAGVIVKATGAGIGDYVWRDLNDNGIQDPDEKGVNGLIVELYRLSEDGTTYEQVATTTTDYKLDPDTHEPITSAAGFYHFDDMANGTYRVKFSLPVDGDPSAEGYSSYQFTVQHAGSDPALDSDAITDSADQYYGFSDPITIDNDHKVTNDIDCGLLCEGAILGDTVWYDANGDGLQNDLDPATGLLRGIGGVTVELYQVNQGVADSTPYAVRVTHTQNPADASDVTPEGYYAFGKIPQGTYQIKFVCPDAGFLGENGWRFTQSGAGTDIQINSKAAQGSGTTDIFEVASTDSQLTWDAGLEYDNSTIGDTVWLDRNGDGYQNDMITDGFGQKVLEGVEGVKVDLYRKDVPVSAFGTLAFDTSGYTAVAHTQTDAKGAYSFDKLAAGEYFVHVTLPGAPLVSGYLNEFSPQTLTLPNNDSLASAVDKDGRSVVIGVDGTEHSYLYADAGIMLVKEGKGKPVTPVKPVKQGTKTNSSKQPKTGDKENLNLVLALAVVSMGAAVALKRNARLRTKGEA